MDGCSGVSPDLKAYLDGELSFLARWRVRRHLAACAICRSQVRELREIGDLVRSADNVAPPASLRARILASLPETPAAAALKPSRRAHPPRIIPAAARRRPPWALAGASAVAALLALAVWTRVPFQGPEAALPVGPESAATSGFKAAPAPGDRPPPETRPPVSGLAKLRAARAPKTAERARAEDIAPKPPRTPRLSAPVPQRRATPASPPVLSPRSGVSGNLAYGRPPEVLEERTDRPATPEALAGAGLGGSSSAAGRAVSPTAQPGPPGLGGMAAAPSLKDAPARTRLVVHTDRPAQAADSLARLAAEKGWTVLPGSDGGKGPSSAAVLVVLAVPDAQKDLFTRELSRVASATTGEGAMPPQTGRATVLRSATGTPDGRTEGPSDSMERTPSEEARKSRAGGDAARRALDLNSQMGQAPGGGQRLDRSVQQEREAPTDALKTAEVHTYVVEFRAAPPPVGAGRRPGAQQRPRPR